MALRMSCLIHTLAFLLLLGCAAHKTIPKPAVPDAEISQAQDFVLAVAGKMPLWDSDAISRYELVEIATVKADIAMARQTDERATFLACVARLHDDWDALVALDEMLKKESLT